MTATNTNTELALFTTRVVLPILSDDQPLSLVLCNPSQSLMSRRRSLYHHSHGRCHIHRNFLLPYLLIPNTTPKNSRPPEIPDVHLIHHRLLDYIILRTLIFYNPLHNIHRTRTLDILSQSRERVRVAFPILRMHHSILILHIKSSNRLVFFSASSRVLLVAKNKFLNESPGANGASACNNCLRARTLPSAQTVSSRT